MLQQFFCLSDYVHFIQSICNSCSQTILIPAIAIELSLHGQTLLNGNLQGFCLLCSIKTAVAVTLVLLTTLGRVTFVLVRLILLTENGLVLVKAVLQIQQLLLVQLLLDE